MELVILSIALSVIIIYDRHTSGTKFAKIMKQCDDLGQQLNNIKLEIQRLNVDLVTIIEENRLMNIEVYKLSTEVSRLKINCAFDKSLDDPLESVINVD